jgi:hypothetical protein
VNPKQRPACLVKKWLNQPHELAIRDAKHQANADKKTRTLWERVFCKRLI